MTHKNEIWLNPKGYEAFRQICSIVIPILIIIVLYLIAFCIITSSPSSETGGVNSSAPPVYNFEDLLDAIEWVESRGDANAVGDNGKAIGSFQLHKIYVDDVNRISRLRHIDKYSYPSQWKYYHRESRPCSRTMVREYLKYYATKERIGRSPTLEDMARIHNGGPAGWRKKSTKKYWLKVKNRMAAKYINPKEKEK